MMMIRCSLFLLEMTKSSNFPVMLVGIFPLEMDMNLADICT